MLGMDRTKRNPVPLPNKNNKNPESTFRKEATIKGKSQNLNLSNMTLPSHAFMSEMKTANKGNKRHGPPKET